jgi:hypothetical protein
MTTPEFSYRPSEPFHQVYYALCKHLMSPKAQDVEVRGLKTKEMIGANFICDPHYPMTGRAGFSDIFALTETLQVVSGRGDMRQLKSLAPQFEKMAPTYVTYGPRIASQLQRVYEKLRDDPLSRQAVIVVYQGEDLYKSYPETPCTLTLQFLAREDWDGKMRLNLVATMRSNDVWYGTPTDVFMFTFIQRQMAASLEMLCGDYVHQAGSIHVYQEHWDKVEAHLETNYNMQSPEPLGLHLRPYPWEVVREKAAKWLDGEIKASTWVEGL